MQFPYSQPRKEYTMNLQDFPARVKMKLVFFYLNLVKLPFLSGYITKLSLNDKYKFAFFSIFTERGTYAADLMARCLHILMDAEMCHITSTRIPFDKLHEQVTKREHLPCPRHTIFYNYQSAHSEFDTIREKYDNTADCVNFKAVFNSDRCFRCKTPQRFRKISSCEP